jgi:ketosteroid isomerase-like protein
MPLSADDIREIAQRYNTATGANDAATMASMTSPEAKVWHNFDDTEVTAEASAKTVAWLFRTVADLTWTERAFSVTDNGWVRQSLMTGNAPGGPIAAHTCVIITLDDDGRIVRTEEYLDPAQLTNLRAKRDA